MSQERQIKVSNQLVFFGILYVIFYIVLSILFHQTLTTRPSLILVMSNLLLLIASFIYWPVILLGYVTMAWVIWAILSLFLLAVAFPFELNFFYWHIPLHVMMIMSISLLKRKDDLSTYTYTQSIQSTKENYNELSKFFEKNQLETSSLNELIQRYSLLHKVLNTLNTSLNEEQIINLITNKSIINKRDYILFYLNQPNSRKIQLRWSSNDHHQESFYKEGDAYDGWVLKHKIPLLVTDVHKDFRFQGLSDRNDLPFQSLISSPLISENQCIGLLRIQSQEKTTFAMDDLRLLNILAYLTNKAITNARLYQQTLDLAIKDSLTGLYVRKYFSEQFDKELSRSIHSQTALSIALIDIDFFKKYNDQYGHSSGDKVLIFLANLLKKELSEVGIVARYGGEEFAILLPEHTKEQAQKVLENVRIKVESATIVLRQVETQISISGGIATFPQDAMLPRELINLADKGLYQAKAEGRNQICCM